LFSSLKSFFSTSLQPKNTQGPSFFLFNLKLPIALSLPSLFKIVFWSCQCCGFF